MTAVHHQPTARHRGKILASTGALGLANGSQSDSHTTLRSPSGVLFCSALILGLYFLRATSIPTGLTSTQLFAGCCGSLSIAFAYLVVFRRRTTNVRIACLALLTLPSLYHAVDINDSILRWIGWVLILSTVGPLFVGELRLKLQALDWTRSLLLFCAVGSLVVNVAGVKLEGRGNFFGLMSHAMTLAPVSALATIDLYSSRKHNKTKFRTALLIACCLTCVATGSRLAVVGLAAALLCHTTSQKEYVYMILLTVAGLAGTSLVQINSSLRQETGLHNELTAKGTINTRSRLWEARIEEFKSSPLTGIGFQQQKSNRRSMATDVRLEPGSSYLAVLSMTGCLGACGFVFLTYSLWDALSTGRSLIPDNYRLLLRGWIIFFSVHLLGEGYIYSCGSLQCVLLWLTIGCTLALQHRYRLLAARPR